MTRRVVLMVAIGLPTLVLVVVGLAVYRPGLPLGGQNVLEAYLAWRNQGTAADWRTAELVHAAQPTRLQSAWSRLTFSIDPYYLTSANGGVVALQAANTGDPGESHIGPSDSRRPLPYPPLDVWCVSLMSAATQEAATVLVARHQDLYNASWIVHDLAVPAEAGELSPTLSALGCAAE
jgi:hypothetical protein